MRLVGPPEVIAEPWFNSGAERAQHADELDAAVGELDRGSATATRSCGHSRRPRRRWRRSTTSADVMRDPQYQALESSIVDVADDELGAGEDAERALPDAGHAGPSPLAGPPTGPGQRGGLRRAGRDAGATGRPSAARRRVSLPADPLLAVRAGQQRQAAGARVHCGRGRRHSRSRRRGAARLRRSARVRWSPRSLAAPRAHAGPLVFVRINHPDTAWPKLTSRPSCALRGWTAGAQDRGRGDRRSAWTAGCASAEPRRGLHSRQVPLVCSMESARGVRNAEEIAAASPRVMA